MSGWDALWGDEFTENDVAEVMEIETQASQAPTQPPVHSRPSRLRNIDFFQRNAESNALDCIPAGTFNPRFRDDHHINQTASSSSSSSSSSIPLSFAQRKLKTPIRSLPNMSLNTTSKEKNQAATTEWLRKELEKHKKNLSELLENRQTLEGEVRLLRERNLAYQQQLAKVREQADLEKKQQEEKFLHHKKELEKEAERAKIQLALKTKEAEANNERYLEMRNVSILEPEFPSTQTPARHKPPQTPRSTIRTGKAAISIEGDNEEDYFSECKVTKRARKDEQSNLKTFTCDEILRVMDGPCATSPIKRPPPKPVVVDLTESPSSSKSAPVKSSGVAVQESVVTVRKVEVVESSSSNLATKFPWLKDKDFSCSVHKGKLLYQEISDKIYALSDPEIKIIVPPCIDFDPGNILKMDSSDLQYLEDLEKGEKIWGVDLKTMYETKKCDSAWEELSKPEDENLEALETVKTILGSQMCGQSPDQSRLNDSIAEPTSPRERSDIKTGHTSNFEDKILLRNLEPIHVYLITLTKLANWDSAIDLITKIVEHITLMVNELYERVCDPRIPDQLKDQFYTNEFAVGKLFMKGPYESNDLLTHKKWTDRERYVELRRGLAVLSLLCSLHRDTANLVFDHELLHNVSKNLYTTIPSNYRSYDQESFLGSGVKKISQRKILCKVDELISKASNMEIPEKSWKKRRETPSSVSSSSTPSTSTFSPSSRPISSDISNPEILNLLKSKESNSDEKSTNEGDMNKSIGSDPSTINADEEMDIEMKEIMEPEPSSSVSRSLDEIDHDSFKAWYDTYTQNKVSFTVEDSESSGSRPHQYSRLLDPCLAEKERKELSVYLQRSQFCKEFYKSVIEKGSVWTPGQDKIDADGYSSDLEGVKNLFDYENKISMNSTISPDELAIMKPGPFCPEKKDSDIDVDFSIKTQDDIPEDNEWRVNSLQKNEEDPNLTKVEEGGEVVAGKDWSIFEKFKTNNAETSKSSPNLETIANVVNSSKQAFSKARKHSLAPLKKKVGKDISPSRSLTDINEEMEMEVEMLFGKSNNIKRFGKQKLQTKEINEISPFAPELRFPEASSDDEQRCETLTELLCSLPSIDDPEFADTFKTYYNQVEIIASRLGAKLKPYKSLVTYAYLEKQKRNSNELEKKKSENRRRPRKSVSGDKRGGTMGVGACSRNQDESDPIITMLNDEAKKHNLKKNTKTFEKRKGKLHILDGIYEIVSSINYCRLTLVFYPLLSSCVYLIESLLLQSFNNEFFNRDLFILMMKILNEVTCCQPPPDVIEKMLNVLMQAVNYPDIVECLCKKRSNLVSLVTKTEFCFFKGVCMMQPLCYLVGALSVTTYPGYWTLCVAFTRWLRQLYDRYRIYLEPWYPPNQVCNCVPVLHSALFTTLAKASAFLANHGSEDLEEGVRLSVESIVRDGIRLCELLIDMDSSFVNHLDKFHLYNEFLATVKEMHYDSFFSPNFQLESHQLKVVECLMNASELLASKSKRNEDQDSCESSKLEHTKQNFTRVFDQNHIFLKCCEKYDLLC